MNLRSKTRNHLPRSRQKCAAGWGGWAAAWATGSSSARGRAGGLLLRIDGAGPSKHGPASCWGRCKKRRCVHGCDSNASVTSTTARLQPPAGPHDRMIPPIPHWHAANLKSEGASCRQNSGSRQPPSVRSPSVYTAGRDTASVRESVRTQSIKTRLRPVPSGLSASVCQTLPVGPARGFLIFRQAGGCGNAPFVLIATDASASGVRTNLLGWY